MEPGKTEPRRAPWRMLSLGSTVWAPFGDHGWRPGLAYVGWLDRAFRSAGAGDAQRAQPPLVADARRLLGGDDRVTGIDPLGEIPQPLAAAASGDGHLAALHHELQQLGDVAVVRPSGGLPCHLARVGQITRGQRPRGGQPPEDVPPACVIGVHPVPVERPPARRIPATGRLPAGHVRSVEGQILGGPDHASQFEQRPVVQRRVQLGG